MRTVERCSVGGTDGFKVAVGLHQVSALIVFLFTVVMDKLTDEVKQECPWTMMFANDIFVRVDSRWKRAWRCFGMLWKEEE